MLVNIAQLAVEIAQEPEGTAANIVAALIGEGPIQFIEEITPQSDLDSMETLILEILTDIPEEALAHAFP